ncbi:MarR family transcriptional regulator [Microbacterium sp. Sa4CUA7]|uniref:MarR family transcriptional regulator n=1 Tax=Microbacterium pullorum TaxID=2762236 RepID=A0ABR8S1L2_9MICO|nr:MarR family transcriptional regulator [Microbacterium pullorum]MBD7957367.1 MarR family transcriptional regulator [Microbacterium pullorum]
MSGLAPEQLIEVFAQDSRALSHALAAERVQPFLGLDLTLSQLKTLMLVASRAASTGRELAEKLRVSAPTVSTGVERLVELGYLQREESAADRRVKTLGATRKGLDLYDEFIGRNETSADLLASLDPEDLAALVRGMSALRRAADARRATPD